MKDLNSIFSGLLFMQSFIIIIMAYYAYKRRQLPGALPFALLCIASFFYSFGYGMEIISTQLWWVNVWSKVQYLGLPFIPALWVLLAFSYTGHLRKELKAFLLILFIEPTLTSVFRLTSEFHGLMYGKMSLVNNGYFQVLQFEKGSWYYFHFVFFFICAGLAIFQYSKTRRTSVGYMRQQLMIMIVASIMPFVAIIWNLSGLTPLQMDSGPFFILINYFLFTYCIFRYNMMHLIPLSREKIFDWIYDGALVFDIQSNLADFNQTINCIFPHLERSMIGQNATVCLKKHPAFTEPLIEWQHQYRDKYGARLENAQSNDVFEFSMSIEGVKDEHHYRVRMKDLFDKQTLIGTTVLISDVTQERNMMLKLTELAELDHLTGLYNRRRFIDLVTEALNAEQETTAEGVLILYDIDHFKIVNDTYGHQAGDLVLSKLATLTRDVMSNSDIIGRYGGEEIILFLPNTNLDEGIKKAESLRKAIESYSFEWFGQVFSITASIGVTESHCKQNKTMRSFDDMVRYADEACYSAKAAGRNCVRASD